MAAPIDVGSRAGVRDRLVTLAPPAPGGSTPPSLSETPSPVRDTTVVLGILLPSMGTVSLNTCHSPCRGAAWCAWDFRQHIIPPRRCTTLPSLWCTGCRSSRLRSGFGISSLHKMNVLARLPALRRPGWRLRFTVLSPHLLTERLCETPIRAYPRRCATRQSCAKRAGLARSGACQEHLLARLRAAARPGVDARSPPHPTAGALGAAFGAPGQRQHRRGPTQGGVVARSGRIRLPTRGEELDVDP